LLDKSEIAGQRGRLRSLEALQVAAQNAVAQRGLIRNRD
jgi:hypothetical protein